MLSPFAEMQAASVFSRYQSEQTTEFIFRQRVAIGGLYRNQMCKFQIARINTLHAVTEVHLPPPVFRQGMCLSVQRQLRK